MRTLTQLIIALILVCFTLNVVGCRAFTNTTLEITTPPSSTISVNTPTSTMTALARFAPSPSTTWTNTPTITSTTTPTPQSPTWTPQPTLPTEEAKALVLSLFETNAGCRLPCWWGFIPGKTDWYEARSLLEQFVRFNQLVQQDQPIFSMDILVPVPETIFHIPLQQIYKVENDIIESMEIELGHAPVERLSAFLKTYGSPGEVWISTYSTEYPPGFLPFLVVLFYPNQGILAIFGPENTWLSSSKVHGCQMDGTPSKYGLWSPEHEMTFMEAAREFRLNPDEKGFLMLPIEEATEMSVEDFYQTYKEPNSSTCIETPKELWPEKF
jgi:hypothetical protein